jgi:hypothetical protein
MVSLVSGFLTNHYCSCADSSDALCDFFPVEEREKRKYSAQIMVIFMVIYKEMELTKNEFLATIYVLVVCFDIGLPVEIRLI